MSSHLIMEVIYDVIVNGSRTFETYRKTPSNILLLVSLLGPDIVLLAYVIPYADITLYICLLHARIGMVVYACAIYASIYGGPLLSNWILVTTVFLGTTASIGDLWGNFILHGSYEMTWDVTRQVIYMILFAFYAWLVFVWGRYIYRSKKDGIELSSDDYCCSYYVFGSFVTFFLWKIMGYFTNTGDGIWNSSVVYITVHVIVGSLFYMFVAFMQIRVIQKEAIITEVRNKTLTLSLYRGHQHRLLTLFSSLNTNSEESGDEKDVRSLHFA
jgi:hypothetical protein